MSAWDQHCNELDKLRKGALSRDEVEAARLALLRTTAFDSDGIASRAGAIGSEHTWGAPEKGGPAEYVAGYGTLTDGPRLDRDLMFEDVFKEVPPHLQKQRALMRAESGRPDGATAEET